MGTDEQANQGDDGQDDPRDLAVASGSGCADDEHEQVGPTERAERATRLYLQGRRVAEVAAELTVSETTVRRWTRRALLNLAEEEREAQATRLERAIESQRAVAAAAWEAYERERRLDEALLRGELDSVRRRAIRGGRQRTGARDDADDADCPPLAMEEYERPKRSAQGPRYLSVALAAQREVARLQGLYARLEQPDRAVRITISRRSDGPENHAPTQEAPRDERREAGDA
ncbi:MAG TPA: helix-turn-helix domain-containing protein [Ktedonobacterales bacterium]|nr:helix-turn-helix domain-containing protein [Ktedonobacterales bacterium]